MRSARDSSSLATAAAGCSLSELSLSSWTWGGTIEGALAVTASLSAEPALISGKTALAAGALRPGIDVLENVGTRDSEPFEHHFGALDVGTVER